MLSNGEVVQTYEYKGLPLEGDPRQFISPDMD